LLISQFREEHYNPNYHQYTVTTVNRVNLYTALRAGGVECFYDYPDLLHQLPFIKQRALLPENGLGVADTLHTRMLSLPLHESMTRKDQHTVITILREFFEGEPY
ncbi:MAG: DegT/DnrJ/EryC1/StrS family aminotransferase, partial [Patescibacteria group bacterium]